MTLPEDVGRPSRPCLSPLRACLTSQELSASHSVTAGSQWPPRTSPITVEVPKAAHRCWGCGPWSSSAPARSSRCQGLQACVKGVSRTHQNTTSDSRSNNKHNIDGSIY